VVLSEHALKSWLALTVNHAEDVAAMLDYARNDFDLYSFSTGLNAARNGDEEMMQPSLYLKMSIQCGANGRLLPHGRALSDGKRTLTGIDHRPGSKSMLGCML